MTILPRSIEMNGKEFTSYLQEEGFDQVIVLHTGDSAAGHVTRAAGMKAEFIPSVNPATVAPGAPLSVQLLVAGRPVGGALIAAVSRDARSSLPHPERCVPTRMVRT